MATAAHKTGQQTFPTFSRRARYERGQSSTQPVLQHGDPHQDPSQTPLALAAYRGSLEELPQRVTKQDRHLVDEWIKNEQKALNVIAAGLRDIDDAIVKTIVEGSEARTEETLRFRRRLRQMRAIKWDSLPGPTAHLVCTLNAENFSRRVIKIVSAGARVSANP